MGKTKEQYLLDRYRKVAMIWVENPQLTFEEIAKLCKIDGKTFYNYRQDETFMAIYKELCQQKYKELESQAIGKLSELVDSGNWNAVKYVLDGVGYKPEDKAKVSVEAAPSIEISIK